MRTEPQFAVADALRKVARSLEAQIDAGRSNWQIDAEDLLQTLLSVADELDPPLTQAASRTPSSA